MRRKKSLRRSKINLVRRNKIRGAVAKDTSTFTKTVAEQLEAIQPPDLISLFDWLERYALKRKVLLPSQIIQNYKDLTPFRKIPTNDLMIQAVWAARFISHNIEGLRLYLRLASDLERAWLSDSGESVNSTLVKIEEQCGVSLWLIEAKIAALQQYEGLEKQKALIQALHSSAPRKLATFYAFYVSQRNETAVTLARLRSNVDRSLSGSDQDEALGLFLKTKLGGLRLSPLSEVELSQYLAVATSTSLIDCYEAAILIATELRARKIRDDITAEIVDKISYFANEDYRAQKLAAIIRKDLQEEAISNTTNFSSSVFSSPQVLADECVRILQNDPKDLDALIIYADLLARQPGLSIDAALPKLYSSLLQHLISLKRRGQGFDAAAAESTKIIANLQFLPLWNSLSGFIDAMTTGLPVYGRSNVTSAIFSKPKICPLDVLFLSDDTAKLLLESCRIGSPSGVLVSIAEQCLLADQGSFADCNRSLGLELKALSALRKGQNELALDCAKSLQKSDAIYDLRLGALIEVHTLSRMRLYDRAIISVGVHCSNDNDLRYVLSVNDLLANKRWRDLSHLKGSIYLSIALDAAASRSGDPEISRNRRFAYDEFLLAHNLTKPAELSQHIAAFPLPAIKYFLKNLCVPEIMDVSFQSFDNSRQLDEERINVCNLLAELDPMSQDQYAEEVKTLTRRLSVQDGLRHVDQSRLYVNVEAISRLSEREIRESFERYKQLSRAGGGFATPEDYHSFISEVLDGGKAVQDAFNQYPQDEASDLLRDMFKIVRDQYLLNPDFGLDAYLSMRIRHGSLSGHLRGPLEERNLLLIRDGTTGEYSSLTLSAGSCLSGYNHDEIQQVLPALKVFSEKIDEIVDELTKRKLQIRSALFAEGFFSRDFPPVALLYLRSRIRETTNVSEFVSQAIFVTELILGSELKNVRSFLTEKTREELEQAISALRKSLEECNAVACADALERELANSIPEVLAALDRIKEWFSPSEVKEASALRSLDEIIDVGIAAAKNARRGFNPIITKNVSDLEAQGSDVLLLFTDILFTILDNIYKHSGLGNSPAVDISFGASKIEGENKAVVTLRVENAVGSLAASKEAQQRVEKIRVRIDRGDYRTEVNREGGTGLLKLKKALSDNSGSRLDFGFVEGQKFFVEVQVVLLILNNATIPQYEVWHEGDHASIVDRG